MENGVRETLVRVAAKASKHNSKNGFSFARLRLYKKEHEMIAAVPSCGEHAILDLK
jgi:hypothetical protein